MKPSINLGYVHGDNAERIGYGRLGVKLAEALKRKGVEVFDHLPEPSDQPGAGGFGNITSDGRNSGLAKIACWISTPTHAQGWWEGQRLALFTMFESTSLPEAFRESLHHFDVVMVPSEQNLELFSRYHPNVKLVPLGVDPKDWHYVPRQKPWPYFDFLIGGSGLRKGTDLAIDAFLELWGEEGSWGDGPIPRLIVKSPRGVQKNRAGQEVEHPRIITIAGKLSAEDEIALYEEAHCYLQPSRGEGFGLQPLQAIAQGLPTVLTDAHGHAGFAALGYPIPARLEQSAYFIYGDAGMWWEPDFEVLVGQMSYVYEEYDSVAARAERSARMVADNFTWGDTAEQFLAALGGAERLCEPPPEMRRWCSPEVRRYLVRVKRPWSCDIAGVSFQFLPGKDYWQVADVKRILFEAGVLHPSCLLATSDEAGSEADQGLAPEQVEKLGLYMAEHGTCQACGQPMGGPTTADLLLEKMLERAAEV